MNEMVKGYVVCNFDSGDHMETMFAVTQEGDVYTTGLRPYSNEFNPKGQKWEKVPAKPFGAEFCGNYPQPNF